MDDLAPGRRTGLAQAVDLADIELIDPSLNEAIHLERLEHLHTYEVVPE